jgi:hypothetical protein
MSREMRNGANNAAAACTSLHGVANESRISETIHELWGLWH